MLKQYHHFVGGVFRVVDACVIGAAWILAYWLRFSLPFFEVTKGFPKFGKYAALTPMVMALWMIVFSAMKVYQSRRMLRRTHEAQLIIRSHLVSMLFFIALTYLFSEYKYSRGVMVYFGVTGAFALVVFRLSLRNGLRAMRKRGYNIRYVLAVGEGPSLDGLLYKLNRFPEIGLKVLGTVISEDSDPMQVKRETHARVLGRFGDLNTLIARFHPDQVLIALPRGQYRDLDKILGTISDETVDVRFVPDIHEFVTLGCEVEDFDGLPIVNLNSSPLDGWGAVLKRVFDIVFSLLALLILTPVYLMISLLVKVTSRGPVVYSQERMGLDGQTFKMLKFRSMRVDAESQTGAVWASERDDRRTPIGAFLRSTSLDELPQFWNVLKGDMSLVGPRPERPVFVSDFRHKIPNYMLRHKVKAGITGWAQINGWRGNTSLEKRIEFDLYYIRHWSMFLDLRILVLTVFRGFINKNAY